MKHGSRTNFPLKRLTALLAACLLAGCMFGLAGCFDQADEPSNSPAPAASQSSSNSSSSSNSASAANQSNAGNNSNGKSASDAKQSNSSSSSASASKQSSSNSDSASAAKQNSSNASKLDKNGSYTSKKDVALYIHTYGCLPSNFISKTKARNAGWDSSAGNLNEVCPGKSIGGSVFYNDEGKLPSAKDRTWKECDINYHGGYRGSERIVFSNDGLVYYTNDHYKTFEQLY